MNIEKLPRWFLVVGFSGFLLLGGFILNGAFADLDHTKNMVQKHDVLIADLTEDISTIKTGSEQYRREYREDQKDLDKKLEEMRGILVRISSKV